MKPIYIKSSTDVKYDDDALEELKKSNDSKYWNDESGIIKVDESRWLAAQKFEIEGWTIHWSDFTEDRPGEHELLFDGYKCLSKILGSVLEIGCGPFTQIEHLIRKLGFTVSNITLVDPMIRRYVRLSNCKYKSGKIMNYPTSLIESKAEDFVTSNNDTKFDTLICINVLEHVQDVKLILNNINENLKSGGTLILGERTYNNLDITKLYDIGHPIRIKSSVLEEFLRQYDIIFRSEVEDHDGYIIATKS
jgi:SAM-dependent methyltransferase